MRKQLRPQDQRHWQSLRHPQFEIRYAAAVDGIDPGVVPLSDPVVILRASSTSQFYVRRLFD
jgi:hypothetical protein